MYKTTYLSTQRQDDGRGKRLERPVVGRVRVSQIGGGGNYH